ncbi:hypothetical protein QBC34DRAFT_162832 [Podospora aff. communis PSN243]|uniref:C2H2-type domain-containing protein n=1 Tax=Podospora aff. communis PSN243 TaxID=3040156 RepID=A0AAV9GCC1_9PEZI|nr:hypothetical protein QBC34DRAFT_162832 [Podospora aff. communis PSN243]
MELARVDALVNGLADAFESGLDFYTKWKKRLEHQNHYRRTEGGSSPAASKDAVSTSLDMSSHRIRATYQVGFALIGPQFSAGDEECRQALTSTLTQLEQRVNILRRALLSSQRHFINLNEMFLASETIRLKSVAALAEQYRRFATGRAVPQEMPIPGRPRSVCQKPDVMAMGPPPPPIRITPAKDFDRETAIWSTNSEMPVFQSEPPSPPLTPKLAADDTESCYGGTLSEVGSRNPRRPKNSVFSIFCPEAMALQVDPNRPIPSTSKGKCECGYKWNVAELAESKGYLAVRDGFRVTKRFLAKSHCDRSSDEGVAIGSSTDQPKPGYGCVLCISTGRTETFESVDSLRTHINTTHHKWQMLHDRDMT